MVLWETFGGKMEKLTQGGENCNGLQENEICGACETFRKNENYGQNIA